MVDVSPVLEQVNTPVASEATLGAAPVEGDPRPYRVSFYTMGCKANQLESSALANGFRANGWEVLPWGSRDASGEMMAPDLVIFNTCTVTERADAEARRLIRKTKRQCPTTRVAVTGCYAQVSPDILAQMPDVDFVIGNNYKDQLFQILSSYDWHETDWENHQTQVFVDEFDKSRELAHVAASESAIDRTRGSLKIQDGCDYKCTYCIIWKGRGPSKSLPVDTVLQRIEAMAEEGFKEIVLTGINIGQYDWDGVDLAGLLNRIAELPGDFRIRLTSLDPLEVTPDLIDVIANHTGRIAPHVHLSAQSSHDGVLKLMARRHHVEDFERICHTLAQRVPGIGIGSDIIVGFPGETDEAFEATYQVLQAVPMHFMHIFRYSPRPGTPAAEAKNPVPDRIRKERAERLSALMDEKNLAYRQPFVGQVLPVLVEGTPGLGFGESSTDSLESSLSHGLAPNYLRVEWEESASHSHVAQPNTWASIRITDAPAEDNVLRGERVIEA